MPLSRKLSLLAAGTFLLSLIGLYNGYPLVYSDTGTYIYSGFDNFIPVDRPVSYGLFIKFFSLGYSAWLVIFVQNIITAFVIFEVMALYGFKKKSFMLYYCSLLLFMVVFTGIGWYSNQLMPDFFAPLALLIIFVLLKRDVILNASGIILILVLIFALISHFSHLLSASVIVLSIILLKIITKRTGDVSFSRIMIVSVIVLSCWMVLPVINYMIEKRFILSKGTHVFLMAHLNDTGLLKQFLDEKCSTAEFETSSLCMYKDSLPPDLSSFIWGDSIVEKTGGWEGSRDEYNRIIRETLKDPEYLFSNFYKSILYGFIQLTKNEIGQGLTAYNEGSPPYQQIHWRFRNELNNYLNSRQNKWNGADLKFGLINTLQSILILLSILSLIIIFTKGGLKLEQSDMIFLVYILSVIILNSFITAGLNSPYARFQARVIWLLPFALILLFLKKYGYILRQKFR